MAISIAFDVGTGAGGGRRAPVYANTKKPLHIVSGNIDLDDSYPTGGESIASIFAKFATCHAVVCPSRQGYDFDVDYSAQKLKVLRAGGAPQSITIKDNDNAASTGVAVYVHVDETIEQGTAFAHLEFVSPTNADGTGTLSNGGATYYLQDDDNAATGGVALYFDEDATLGTRLLANTGRDCYVMVSNGEFIKVTHNATPGTPGVQVYFDEDAANSYNRLLFVSPTNADGTAQTAADLTMRRSTTAEEVPAATDLSGIDGVRFVAFGIPGASATS